MDFYTHWGGYKWELYLCSCKALQKNSSYVDKFVLDDSQMKHTYNKTNFSFEED